MSSARTDSPLLSSMVLSLRALNSWLSSDYSLAVTKAVSFFFSDVKLELRLE